MAYQFARFAVERNEISESAENFLSNHNLSRLRALHANGAGGVDRYSSDGPRLSATRTNANTKVSDIPVANAIAAGAAASISSVLYNPLDCLRVRWQVAPKSDPSTSGGIFRFGANIIKSEGLIAGLWRPGLTANATGMCLSAAARFSSYEYVRDALVSLSAGENLEGEKKSAIHMMAAGMICGALGYAWTTPFHLIKTKIQAERGLVGPGGIYLTGLRAGKEVYIESLLSGATKLARDHGALSLFRGTLPVSARGALFTSGQLIGYDGLKTLAREHDIRDGPALHILSSVSASLGASFFSAPADLIMAKYVTDRRYTSLLTCIRDIHTQAGVSGFWRGWAISFVRLTPVSMTFLMLYEQFRLRLGLGYLS